MKRLSLSLLLSVLALSCILGVAGAQSKPEFRLGFKALADQIPTVVGQAIEEEHWGANGDSLQTTTTGLMAWRKADNWTAYTNGSRTWINGPFGVQERGNLEKFDWEAQEPGTKRISPITAEPLKPLPPTVAVTSTPTPSGSSGGSSGGYTNVDGNRVPSPGSNPAGASAQCRDGTYSYSQHRSGTCSGHGGVARWMQ